MRLALAVLLLMIAAFPASAGAVEARYAFDPAGTSIRFTIGHTGFATARGQFLQFDGWLDLDPAAPESARTHVVVATESLSMEQPELDGEVKGRNFFKAAAFPEMTFDSTRVTRTGETTAQVHGDLTLRGRTRPIVLEVTMTHNDTGTVGFAARGVIRRKDFGMDYLPGVVDDKVRLVIEATAVRQPAP